MIEYSADIKICAVECLQQWHGWQVLAHLQGNCMYRIAFFCKISIVCEHEKDKKNFPKGKQWLFLGGGITVLGFVFFCVL